MNEDADWSDCAGQGGELSAIEQILPGRSDVLWRLPSGAWCQNTGSEICGLLCGSFNPLHEGHMNLLETAAEWLGGTVAFELSLQNADKPPLDNAVALRRCGQFDGYLLAVTRSATFAAKSSVFPGTTFVVGADTAARIVDPRFYGGDPDAMSTALKLIGSTGCRFLVAARIMDKRLLTLESLGIPGDHKGLFAALPEESFRLDVSSTEMRKRE